MFYIIALGNPGEKYKDTRHNVGWLAVDHCIEKLGFAAPVESSALSGRVSKGVISGEETTILYPSTFMNNSGSAVVKLVPGHELEQLIVIHDDIDLPFGEVKIGFGRGAGGNQGVLSIIEKLGSKDFVRVRIGIAPKSIWTGKVKRPQGGGPLERFVLKPFTTTEQKQLPEIFERVKDAIGIIASDGVEAAMNKFNVGLKETN
jgi:PTH1 family peptidyl-tRNA hydrolase